MAATGQTKTMGNETPFESSPANGLRVAVARIYRALRSTSDHKVTPSQSSALARIENSEPVRIGILAQLEGITPASMSKIVDSLVDLDLVVREPDALDGRVSLLRIAPTGRQMIYELRSKSTRALENALSTLSHHERAVINESLPVLERLAEALQALESTP